MLHEQLKIAWISTPNAFSLPTRSAPMCLNGVYNSWWAAERSGVKKVAGGWAWTCALRSLAIAAAMRGLMRAGEARSSWDLHGAGCNSRLVCTPVSTQVLPWTSSPTLREREKEREEKGLCQDLHRSSLPLPRGGGGRGKGGSGEWVPEVWIRRL